MIAFKEQKEASTLVPETNVITGGQKFQKIKCRPLIVLVVLLLPRKQCSLTGEVLG